MPDKTVKLYDGAVTLRFDEKAHAYFWEEEGKFVGGVTKILSCLDKPALVNWAAGMAADYVSSQVMDVAFSEEEAGTLRLNPETFKVICRDAKSAHRKFSKEATDVGKQVHSFAERALVEQRVTMPADPQVRAGAEAFLGWLHANQIETMHSERMLFSKQYFYAGTVDWLGKLNGTLCVLDFKTSSRIYMEMLLQIAAYGIALSEEFGEPINHGCIVRLDKRTGKCEPHSFEITDDLRQAFIRVRGVHQSLSKLDEMLDAIRKAA